MTANLLEQGNGSTSQTPEKGVEEADTPVTLEATPSAEEQASAELGRRLAALEATTGQTVDRKTAESHLSQSLSEQSFPQQPVETEKPASAEKPVTPEKTTIWEDIQELIDSIVRIFSGKKSEVGGAKKSKNEKEPWNNGEYTPEDPDAPVFSFPKGTGARVTSLMGPRDAPKTKTGHGSTDHKGYDIGVPEGTPILLTADTAQVKAVKTQPAGAGHYLVLELPDGSQVYFMHLREEPSFKEGQTLKRGDLLAFSGNSGNSSGPHLHYEVRQNGVAVNPDSYLDESFQRSAVA